MMMGSPGSEHTLQHHLDSQQPPYFETFVQIKIFLKRWTARPEKNILCTSHALVIIDSFIILFGLDFFYFSVRFLCRLILAGLILPRALIVSGFCAPWTDLNAIWIRVVVSALRTYLINPWTGSEIEKNINLIINALKGIACTDVWVKGIDWIEMVLKSKLSMTYDTFYGKWSEYEINREM